MNNDHVCQNHHHYSRSRNNNGKQFEDLYQLKEMLGKGAYSVVRECIPRCRSHNNSSFAVKCLDRKKLNKMHIDESTVWNEIMILNMLQQHKNIIRLQDFFSDNDTFYLVLEHGQGGELYHRLVQKGFYSEQEARVIGQQLLQAVEYMHSKQIAHLDLKPENILFSSNNVLKLADFGLAEKVSQRNSLTARCGSPSYMAPEILKGTPYDERADMWSIGVILFVLLSGTRPFADKNSDEKCRKIIHGDYQFDPLFWDMISDEAKDLISGLLTVDPNDRLSASQALKHSWFLSQPKEQQDELVVNKENHSVPINHNSKTEQMISSTTGSSRTTTTVKRSFGKLTRNVRALKRTFGVAG